jgi:hypothetical protein
LGRSFGYFLSEGASLHAIFWSLSGIFFVQSVFGSKKILSGFLLFWKSFLIVSIGEILSDFLSFQKSFSIVSLLHYILIN